MKKLLVLLLLSIGVLTAQDSTANFAQGVILTGISSADTAVTLVSGQTARFPISQYNVVIWDYSVYGWNITNAYYNSKAEIVRVRGNSSNVLTITRAQEGTTARNFNVVGHTYYIALTTTNKWFQDVRDSITAFRVFIRSSTNQAELDSISAHRTALNLLKDTTGAHNTRINTDKQVMLDSVSALRTSITAQSLSALLDSINNHTDTLQSHDVRISASRQLTLDSTSAHNTRINANKQLWTDSTSAHNARINANKQLWADSNAVYRGLLNAYKDSIAQHRYIIDSLVDKKTTTFISKQEVGAGTTVYGMLGGVTTSANEYQVNIPVAKGKFKNLRVWLVGNVGITSYTVALRKNGSTQSLAVVASAGATGVLTTDLNQSHNFTTVTNDLVNLLITVGAGFTPTFCYIAVDFVQYPY